MRRNKKKGQGLTEYIIIVVIVAIAAIAIVGVFSDTIREKFGGAVETLGDTYDGGGNVDAAIGDKSEDILKQLDRSGVQ